MTATYQQIPGDLSIVCVVGDELNLALQITDESGENPIDVTGYTFTAEVYATDAGTGAGWTTGDGLQVGNTVATFTINPVDLELGQINIGLDETATADISPIASHRWYLRQQDGDGVTITILAGTFTARIP